MGATMTSKSASRKQSESSEGSVADTPRTDLPATVEVGKVIRPHGVRGEVKVEIWSDVPTRFKPGRELLLTSTASRSAGRRKTADRQKTVRIETIRFDRAVALIGFAGFEDREAAETLRGAVLEVDRSEVPPAPDGVYYTWELTGCLCVDAEEGELGRVRDVIEDGGGYLLQVARGVGGEDPESGDGGKGDLLIPFVDAFLDEVDVVHGRIDLRLPPGLIETCTSGS